MPDEDKPTFTADDLSHMKGDDRGESADPGKDAGTPGGDAAADASKAPAATDKTTTAGKAAGEGKAAGDKPTAKEDGEDGAEDDTLLGSDEDDGPVEADGKDGADEAADGKDKKDDKAPAWRDAVVKEAEAKWLKKAKTEEQKQEVATRVEALKKQIARYGSLEAAAVAGMEAQRELRSKQDRQKPGKDATLEEVAAYRDSVGLPKEAKDYSIPRVEVTTPDGRRDAIKWTDEHKPLHDSFRELAFANDMSQAQVDALVKWQAASEEEAVRQREDRIRAIDKADKKEAREVLRDELGEEFQPRLAVVDRLLKDDERLPGGAGKMLYEARTPDGSKLVHHPVILRLFSDLAVSGSAPWEPYGDGAIMTGDAKAAIADDEENIVRIMKSDFDRYIREGWDKKLTALRERKAGKGKKAA